MLGFGTGSRAHCEGSWFQVESFRCRGMGKAHVGHHPSLHSTVASLDEEEDKIKKLSTLRDWSQELDFVSQSWVLLSLPVPLENMKKTHPLFRQACPLCTGDAVLVVWGPSPLLCCFGPRWEGCDLGEPPCPSWVQESSS